MTQEGGAWLVVGGGALTPAWSGRAVELFLVPLTPDEEQAILAGERPSPDLTREDLSLATLLAKGFSVRQIARELDVSVRSVYYRLGRLREAFRVDSTPELVVQLARRGFTELQSFAKQAKRGSSSAERTDSRGRSDHAVGTDKEQEGSE